MALVSVIIPAFNAASFIARSLEGVRRQTHTDIEVIVVEDGSNDGTEQLVFEFSKSSGISVSYTNHGENFGVSETRNRALSIARGEVIAFLDSDDWWTDDHLRMGMNALRGGAGLCYSGFHLHDEATGKSIKAPPPSDAQLQTPLVAIFEANFIQTSSLMMLKREVFDANGNFDPNLKVGEDCDYWLRALGRGWQLAYTGHASCNYVKHPDSAMSKTLMVSEHMARFYQKHLQSSFVPKTLRRKCYARSLLNWGRLVRRDNPRLARSLFFQGWRTQPLNWICAFYAMASFGPTGRNGERSLMVNGIHNS